MRKWILSIGLTLIVLIVLAVVYVWNFLNGMPSKLSSIADFHPTNFSARAKSPFFYSVGKALRYGDTITSSGLKLFDVQSWIKNPVVSPDNTMMAFVDDSELYIVRREAGVLKVTPVDTIYRGLDGEAPKPIGRFFFRDQDFQWTSDSRSLYLIRDQYYDSKGSQLFSEYGELWRYDLATGSLQLVLKPFEAFQYFFGLNGIYFSVPTPKGDLQLRYFDGKQTVNIGDPDQSLSEQTLQNGKKEQIFYSFDTVLDASRADHGPQVDTKLDEPHHVQGWMVNGDEFLTVTEGDGFKGHYYCGSPEKTRYLPGNEFAFLDLAGCGTFDGQLVLDLSTRQYATLPKDTRIYLMLNTNNSKNYSLSDGGITFR